MRGAQRGDFTRLWAALSISLLGSEITILALPLIAARTLHASALQMGLLAAAAQAPFLVLSLPAGAWVDRLPRRPVLIAADLASAVLLLSIPAAVLVGGPIFVQLCFVAFGIGAFTVVSEVAHYAYVPTLVGRAQLTRCNSRLQLSHSSAAAGGPGLGGLLIQFLTAPIAVVLDAVSFVVSALLLRSIHRQEPPVEPESDPDQGLRDAVRDGLRMLLGHKLLRPIIVISALAGFFEAGLLALYILYATRNLHLGPALIGVVFAAGGLGAIPGSLLAERVGARFGAGRAIIGGWAVAGVAALLVPLAAGPIAVVVGILMIGKAVGGITDSVANVHQWTLRQMVTPDRLAGRVTASHRFIVYGACAFGAMTGGFIASIIGVRAALFAFAAGMIASPLIGVVTDLRDLHDQPRDVTGPSLAAGPSAATEERVVLQV